MADLARALRTWLAERGHDVDVEVLARASGGLSQETWFVRLASGSSIEDAVLRLPTAASGGRAIAAQIGALRAVAGSGVPAPRLLWWSADEELAGRPFLVMSRVQGTVPVGWHVLPARRRAALATRAVDILADIHAIPLRGSVFAGHPTHPLMTLDGLSRATSRLGPVPLPIEAALAWLQRHRPADDRAAVLVHGDYRMGNFVVAAAEIRAVLDWELASPGPREVDLVWCFLPVFEEPGVDVSKLVVRYEQRAGLVVDRSVLAWHRVQALVRLAYYSLSATRAFDSSRSQDLRLAALRLRLPANLRRVAAAMQDPALPGHR